MTNFFGNSLLTKNTITNCEWRKWHFHTCIHYYYHHFTSSFVMAAFMYLRAYQVIRDTFLTDFRTPCRSSPMWHLKIFSWTHVLPCVTWYFHKRLCFFQYFLWWNVSQKMSQDRFMLVFFEGGGDCQKNCW